MFGMAMCSYLILLFSKTSNSTETSTFSLFIRAWIVRLGQSKPL
jgi:hypothetical protein